MAAPNFANRTLWTGDNLDILRGLNTASVDLIYLDPPFNSSQDYAAPIGSEAAGAAFKDTWALSDVDEAWHGEIADRQPALYAIIDAASLAHGKGMKSYLIMMAVRLIELQRVLKPTGSLYLHCDSYAVHYLKMLMDAIVGPPAWRGDIAWLRQIGVKNFAVKQPGRVHDRLLFYGRAYYPANVQRALTAKQRAAFRHDDPRYGRYKADNLTAPGLRHGESGEPWRGFDPGQFGRHWGVPQAGRLAAWIDEAVIPGYRRRGTHLRLDALDKAGLIHWPKKVGGWPLVKRPLHTSAGTPLTDIWDDVAPLARSAAERTGYPTQKPLALLDRIIRASSNEGDVVLDPFCGCATTLVAADRLGRQWVGIDLSPMAARLVLQRLREDRGPLFDDMMHRTDIPTRTDLGTLPNYRTYKHRLYGRQEGVCTGCRVLFPFRNFTVDHVIPRSRGGADHLDNLQLLCAACNSVKGDRDQAYLVARLKELGHAQT